MTSTTQSQRRTGKRPTLDLIPNSRMLPYMKKRHTEVLFVDVQQKAKNPSLEVTNYKE